MVVRYTVRDSIPDMSLTMERHLSISADGAMYMIAERGYAGYFIPPGTYCAVAQASGSTAAWGVTYGVGPGWAIGHSYSLRLFRGSRRPRADSLQSAINID